MTANVPRKFGHHGVSEPFSREIVGFWKQQKPVMGDISPKATRTALILSCTAETNFQISKVMPNLDVFELHGLGPKENRLFTSLGRRTRRNTTSMVSMVQNMNHGANHEQ